MDTFFQDILYPADKKELASLIDREAEAIDAKVILLPHARASLVAPFYSSALKNLSGKKIVFLAPLHNERMQSHMEDSLLTVSGGDYEEGVRVESAPSLPVENAILEEEYTLELFLAFLSQMSKGCTVYPIFTSLSNRKEIKELSVYLGTFKDAVIVISGNFASGNTNLEAYRSARLALSLLERDESLIDEGNRGHLSGCCWQLLEATRRLGGSFSLIASRCGESISDDIVEADGKVYQVFAVRN